MQTLPRLNVVLTFRKVRQIGEIVRTRPDRPQGPRSLLYNEYRVSFPAVNRPGRGVDHSPQPSAEGKVGIELDLSSRSGR